MPPDALSSVPSNKEHDVIRQVKVTLAALGLLLLACGGGAKTNVKVSEAEWKMAPEVVQTKPGKVAFNVTNDGTEPHEFIVIRSDLPVYGLPIVDDKVNEDAVDIVGQVEPFDPGHAATVTANLTPGRYLLICNVKEGGVGATPLVSHYQKGMRIAFTVAQ